MTQTGDSLAEALVHCRQDRVRTLVRERIDAGVPPAEIIAECNRGMVELGNRFEAGECYVPELMVGGMIMKGVMGELAPLVGATQAGPSLGKVVIGSVQHDIHDIGKDIVVMMLRGVGFEVVDLGVDVPPARFVEAIGRHQPMAVGLSVLLTTCFSSVGATVDAIREAGRRDDVSIMLGGAAASELLRSSAGCDFYGKTAVDGMKYVSRLAGVE
jgi:5-methyltetrahydrofolate--homocysteine methyltransferase